jgi:aminomuconate-semialdehyde/2-hydroxymuconate-6-semialdehyde dehydrogenase
MPDIEKIANFIDGELRPPLSGEYLENYNPSTGEVYSLIPDSDHRDVELAVKAAEKAFNKWSGSPPQYRSEILLNLANLIERQSEEFSIAESIDNGKPLSLARRLDIPRAVANLKFYATAILHTSNESWETVLPGGENAINYTLRKPAGIAGCISPWNLPIYLFTWKIAPALAAGCTVVAKPSEITPYTAFMLSRLAKDAGMPDGVLNVIHGIGSKAGAAIVDNKKIKAITFTGGTKTGASIARSAASGFKKLSLELGGKNPNIIFADCDFDLMIETTVRSSFLNQGEICLCGSRILVEKAIYEDFLSRFAERTKQLRLGDPLEKETDVGAIVSKEHFEKIMSYIELAESEGGQVLAGGNSIKPDGRCSGGWFIEPTVIRGLGKDCRLNQEEIFGPVVTVLPFEGEQEAISLANDVRYGLSATIWTENLSRAHRVAAALEAGVIWINCWLLRDLRTPFGGMKDSGLGREGGFEALRFFTEEKNICLKVN